MRSLAMRVTVVVGEQLQKLPGYIRDWVGRLASILLCLSYGINTPCA
jgi:hypothetical protein